MSHPTSYWHMTESGRVQCDVCPRSCQLTEGQQGLCFVRSCEAGEIVLDTYGRSSGFCIDPIEKKPLYHFLPGTPVLSFGTAGCNLFCKFCQNWDMSKARSFDALQVEASPEKIAQVALDHGCRSVAFTYNDPVIFMEYAIDVAKACHEKGVKTIAVSAGYMCEKPREDFYRYMDAANIDLKAFSDDFYRKICGGDLQSVLDTLVYLKTKTKVWFEITTLLIPGENDSSEEIYEMCKWIKANLGERVPIHFSAFHPDFKMLYKERTPLATVRRAVGIARECGLLYVYSGNVHDPENDSTYCHSCGQMLIGRDWYDLNDWNLKEGHCSHCGALCSGVFEMISGSWGRRRLPIDMA